MSYELNEITPQDSYIVIINCSIDIASINNLIRLYQPIIGAEAVSFYLTLCNHVSDCRKGYSDICLHKNLMSKMNLAFPKIKKAAEILEAIGLLRTKEYKQKDFGEYLFEYTICLPLEPREFFLSDILSMLLVNRLGKKQFKDLQAGMLDSNLWNKGEYIEEREITKSFDEVFDSLLVSDIQKNIDSETGELIFSHVEGNSNDTITELKMEKKYIDLEFIKGMVSNLYQLDKVLDKKVISALQEIAFLYQFSDMDIINLLNDHTIYTSTGKIDEELLRARAREKYLSTQQEITIVEKNKIQRHAKKESASVNVENKAERHIWILENYSPIELVQQYQGEGKIPDADIKLIDTLLYEYKLPSGVVNVLIEYILISNDYKLPKNLVEKIAGQWKRLKINTVKDALVLAKKEHKLYTDWKNSNNKPKNNIRDGNKSSRTSNVKKEKVPDYILNQDKKYSDNKEEKEIDPQKLAEIDRLLKNLGEK